MVDDRVQTAYNDLRGALLDDSFGLIPKIESNRWQKIKVKDVLAGFKMVNTRLDYLSKEVKRAWIEKKDKASDSAQVEALAKAINDILKEPINLLTIYDDRYGNSYIQDVALVNMSKKPQDTFLGVAHWTKYHFSQIYTTLQRAGLIKK